MRRVCIPKKKDDAMGTQKFLCPNPLCGKTFENPMKVKNLNSKNTPAYDACPRCLTEIVVEETPIPEERPSAITKETKVEKTVGHQVNQTEIKPHCAHHFGYLSQRSPKEKIPEDCIVCENIVKCMLKAVTG